MTLQEIIQHFQNAKQIGNNQYSANCPACGDSKGHLYISESNGKILIDCKKGCTFNEIVQASGLQKTDFFPPKPQKRAWIKLREHIYTDTEGNPIARKTIYDKGNGSKTAQWERYENGIYINGLNGLKVPPYHVHNLKERKSVIIAEGEKDVETLEKMKFCASCSPNGAGGRTSWVKGHNEYFRGKAVIILTDNDEAGREHGRATAESLCGVAESVRLIPSESVYPQLKEKGDISDIVQAVGLDEAKEMLIEAVKASDLYTKTAPLFPEPKHTESERKSYIVNKCLKQNEELISRLEALKPVNYHHSDRGSSDLFADMFRREVRYNTTAKEWFFYDGKVWRIDTGGMVVHAKAKQLFDALMIYAVSIEDEQIQKLFREYYGKFGSKNKRDTLIKDAADCCYISSEELDKNPKLFNCQNGTFELDTMKFREHRADDYITKISNVVYDEKAVSEDWNRFINEVLPHDREKVRYLQKAVGYSLSGTCSLETCFILYGATTRNGKSTLVSTISYMLGDSNGYARAAQPEVLAMRKNRDSRNASEDIARLAGCRFLNVSEPPQSMAFDAALLKTLTGRDTITARFLFQGSFEYVPQFTLFINTNYLPKVLDETLFTSNRINVIEFNRHFSPEEQDINLKERLRTEQNISGLFNWCIEGLKLFRQEGLNQPLSVSIATRQYAQQSDKLWNFIDECLEESQGGGCTAKEAYEVYKKWCTDCGYFSEGKQKFIELLRGKELLREREKINGIWEKRVIPNYSIAYEG